MTSGVFTKLRGLALYSKYLTPQQEELRRNSFQDFWVRSTIPWNIQCETEPGKTRPEIVNVFKNTSVNPPKSGKNLMTASICLLIFTIICGLLAAITSCCLQRAKWPFITAMVCLFVTLVTCAALSYVYSKTAVGENQYMREFALEYSIVNGCSDAQTFVDVEKVDNRLAQAN